jgi:uncharacterized protein YjbJ (UPF0337 family)
VGTSETVPARAGFAPARRGNIAPAIDEGGEMADWDEVEGKTKEVAGDATGDEKLEREGKAQGAWGSVKDDAGDAFDEAKDKAKDTVDDAKDRS